MMVLWSIVGLVIQGCEATNTAGSKAPNIAANGSAPDKSAATGNVSDTGLLSKLGETAGTSTEGEKKAKGAISTTRAAGENPSSMRAAVQAAVDHSADIRSVQSKLAQSKVGISIARSGYMPTLQSSVGGGVGYDYQTSLSQPLYDFGQTSAKVEQAKSGHEATTAELKGTL